MAAPVLLGAAVYAVAYRLSGGRELQMLLAGGATPEA